VLNALFSKVFIAHSTEILFI